MGADPEPDEAIGRLNGQRPVTVTHSGGPIAAGFLEPEGRVARVGFQAAARTPVTRNASERVGLARLVAGHGLVRQPVKTPGPGVGLDLFVP